MAESFLDGGLRKRESKENVPLWGSGRSSGLCRSRSMDFLAQREPASTKALCALFESKADPRPSFNSSPKQHPTAATGCKTTGERPLRDQVRHNNPSAQVSTRHRFYEATKHTHQVLLHRMEPLHAPVHSYPELKRKPSQRCAEFLPLQPSACKQ